MVFQYEKKYLVYRREAYSIIEQLLSVGIYTYTPLEIQAIIANKIKIKLDKKFVEYYKNNYGFEFTCYNYFECLAQMESDELFGESRNVYLSTFIVENFQFLDNKNKKKLYNLMIREKIDCFKPLCEIKTRYNNNSILNIIKDAILLRYETETNPHYS